MSQRKTPKEKILDVENLFYDFHFDYSLIFGLEHNFLYICNFKKLDTRE